MKYIIMYQKGFDLMNKRSIALILCFALTLSMLVSPEQSAAKKAKLKLNKKKATLYVGKSVQLKVKGTKKKAKWKSSNKKVAAVSSKGKVSAKKKGTARITAKIGKKKLVCRVTVKNKKKPVPVHTGSVNTAPSQPQTSSDPGVGASAQPQTSLKPGDKPSLSASPIPDPGDKPSPSASASSDPGNKPSPSASATSDPGTKPSPSASASSDPGTKPSPSAAATLDPGTKPSPSAAATAKPGTKPSASPATSPGVKPSPSATATTAPGEYPTEIVSMKDTYDDIFGKTGTCINLVQLQDAETLEYVKKHYSSFTLENEMKPDYLMPGWLKPISTEEAKKKTGDYVIPESYKETTVPQFNYDTVDKVLKIAKENGLKIRYHVLVWHSQSPEWFFKVNYSQDEAAEYVSEEVMYERMRMYISSMIHHVYTLDNGAYKDVVYTWDVANEYFSNTPDKNWAAVFGNRENIEGKTSTDRPALGTRPTYIKRAFEMAYDALAEFGLQDKVPLFYNDFNTYFTKEKIIEMINFINEDRKVCSGVGMQSHLALANPTVDTYVNTVAAFVQEGFQVQITELDVGCTPNKDKDDPDPTKEELAVAYQKQAEYVKELTKQLITLQKWSGNKITGLTWWGLYDAISWRKYEHVLMFDKDMNDAKPSYYAFMQAAKEVPDEPVKPSVSSAVKLDFNTQGSYESDSQGAVCQLNEDGSLTITFTAQHAGVRFDLPASLKKDSPYKSVVLTYTSTGDNVGHSFYTAAGEKTSWGSIKAAAVEKTCGINTAGDYTVNDILQGFKIFNSAEATLENPVIITIKSLIFYEKTAYYPWELNPDEVQTPEPEPEPDLEAPPEGEGWQALPLDQMSDGVKEEGRVVLNDIEQVTVPLPKTMEGDGKKLEVVVKGTLGTSSQGLRMWLANGTGTASDQYYFTKTGVGFGGAGDADVFFKTGAFELQKVLTVGHTEKEERVTTANNLLLKAPAPGAKMQEVTIYGIYVREVQE